MLWFKCRIAILIWSLTCINWLFSRCLNVQEDLNQGLFSLALVMQGVISSFLLFQEVIGFCKWLENLLLKLHTGFSLFFVVTCQHCGSSITWICRDMSMSCKLSPSKQQRGWYVYFIRSFLRRNSIENPTHLLKLSPCNATHINGGIEHAFLLEARHESKLTHLCSWWLRMQTDVDRSTVPLDALMSMGAAVYAESLKVGDLQQGKIFQGLQDFLNKSRMGSNHFDRDKLSHDLYYSTLYIVEVGTLNHLLSLKVVHNFFKHLHSPAPCLPYCDLSY